MMYLQTPKRTSAFPPTPSSYGNVKTSLPPLSSILSSTPSHNDITSTPFVPTKLPSIDSFSSTPTSSRYFHSSQRPFGSYSAPTFPTPPTTRRSTVANLSVDTSEADISITDMRRTSSSTFVPPSTTHILKNINGTVSAPATSHPTPSMTAAPLLPPPAPVAAPVVATSASLDSKSYAFISHSPATFPSQEPSIDNAPLARRKRRRTSPNELSILNREFVLGSTPNKLRRIEIAEKVSMTEKAVQIWFQNKRQSLRKQSNQEKEITELPPTPVAMAPQAHMVPGQPIPVPSNNFLPTPNANQPSIISSTPTKPLVKSNSFIDSPITTSSPIKQRPRSIPNFSKTPILSTPFNTKVLNSTQTPAEAATPVPEVDDANTSIDDSMIIHSQHRQTLVLNETRKKQPLLLNSNSSSTMTFKLTPTSASSKVNQKLSSLQNDDSKSSIHSILNDSSATKTARKPLGELSSNTLSKPVLKKGDRKDSAAENLLSLRTGTWS